MLLWHPSEFWRASTWDVIEAYEGWARANGVKKDMRLPSEEDRKALRARLEREKKAHG